MKKKVQKCNCTRTRVLTPSQLFKIRGGGGGVDHGSNPIGHGSGGQGTSGQSH